MNREEELQRLCAERSDKLVAQAAHIVTLEARLKKARELAHLGGWSA